MRATRTFNLNLNSPAIRHGERIRVTIQDAGSPKDALDLLREWAEDIARCEGMEPDRTAEALIAPACPERHN